MVLVMTIVACTLAGPALLCAQSYPVTEAPIATLPQGSDLETLVFSEDGTHWACRQAAADGERVIGDRMYSERAYKECRGPAFAPVTGTLGYSIKEADGSYSIVIDGRVYPAKSLLPVWFWFSPAGRRWVAWSFEGDPSSYEAAAKTRGIRVWVDGKEAGRYWDASLPAFSPDEAHLSYLVSDNETVKLVTDGVVIDIEALSQVMVASFLGPNMYCQTELAYLSDNTLCMIVPGKTKWSVRVGSRSLAEYLNPLFTFGGAIHHFIWNEPDDIEDSTVAPRSLVTARKAPMAAWWARREKDGPWVCSLSDGREFSANPDVSPTSDSIALSPDGKHVAFRWRLCETEGGERRTAAASVCIDGQAGPRYTWLGGITFSPDSSRVAYWAQPMGSKQYVYVVDGEEVCAQADVITGYGFSADSRHYAYAAKRGAQMSVSLDRAETMVPCEAVYGVRFCPEGTLSFSGRRGMELCSFEIKPGAAATP